MSSGRQAGERGRWRTPWRWLAWLGIAAWRIAGVGAQEPAQVAQITNLVGSALTAFPVPRWTNAFQGQTLRSREWIRAGSTSQVGILVFPTPSVPKLRSMRISGGGQAQMPEGVETVTLGPGVYHLMSRLASAIWAWETTTVFCSVKGTDLEVWVGHDGSVRVRVAQGEVEMRKQDRPSDSVTLRSGEAGEYDAPTQGLRKVPYFEAGQFDRLAQNFLYYPGFLYLPDVGLDAETLPDLASSLARYEVGDLVGALREYPMGRAVEDDRERIYLASLYLVVGGAAEAEKLIGAVIQGKNADDPLRVVAESVRTLVKVLQRRPAPGRSSPTSASAWLAESYVEQLGDPGGSERGVRHRERDPLERARAAAEQATQEAGDFGFAWVRLAELEFSFGEIRRAQDALEKSGRHQSENPHAVALAGFLAWARNQRDEARAAFRQAAILDPRLGNGWLGSGLERFRSGEAPKGAWGASLFPGWRANPESAALADLEQAVRAEPERSLLRTYLGRAYYESAGLVDPDLALRTNGIQQLEHARRLDPHDPTPALLRSLVRYRENRVNEAISDLQDSMRLNQRRAGFRSTRLLDQDRAVRGGNLAALYREAGLLEVGTQEAAAAVNADFANAAAHLFLAGTFDRQRDPYQGALRYETAWLSEHLVGHLLAPVGAGSLSTMVSQQEYSPLFERDGLGGMVFTEVSSEGRWEQQVSQYGTFAPLAYSVDVHHVQGDRNERDDRPNSDYRATTLWTRLKAQLTPDDSLFFEVQTLNREQGDVADHEWPSQASRTQRVEEEQQPNLWVGYHHRWGPEADTLLLVGRLSDGFTRKDSEYPAILVNTSARDNLRVIRTDTPFHQLTYDSELEAYSAELLQWWSNGPFDVVGGLRYQTGETSTWADTYRAKDGDPFESDPVPSPAYRPSHRVDAGLERWAAYAYLTWAPVPELSLTAGMAYDELRHPRNTEAPPIDDSESGMRVVNPKLALRWNITPEIRLRAMYAQSLGGVFYDQSARLEPVQLAGFVQAFRNGIPESVAGLVPGMRFDIFGAAIDAQISAHSWVMVSFEGMNTRARRSSGAYFRYETDLEDARPDQLIEDIRYQERAVSVTWNRLLGDCWSAGAQFRFSHAASDHLFQSALPLKTFLGDDSWQHREIEALLFSSRVFVRFQDPGGFFADAEGLHFAQVKEWQMYEGSPSEGDAFFHLNAAAGFRWAQRRAELRVTALNLLAQDYHLHSFNGPVALPRDRTLAVSFRFEF